MESLLLVSGCLECVGGVWHKRGFQLTEPGTDGAGKWGTSQKHWNPLQRPSPHLSLSLSPACTLCFSLLFSLSSINGSVVLCQDYLRTLVIAHASVICSERCSSTLRKGANLLRVRMPDTSREHGVLWVIRQYEFLFTWMEPADGRVGFGLVQGNATESQRKNAGLLKHSLVALL